MQEHDARKLVSRFMKELSRNNTEYLRDIFDRSRVTIGDFCRIMNENNLRAGEFNDDYEYKIELVEYDESLPKGWYAAAPFIDKSKGETDFSIEFSIDDETNSISVDDFRIL